MRVHNVASAAILQIGLATVYNTSNAPVSWAACSACVWASFVLARGFKNLSLWDQYQLCWATGSFAAFLNFVCFLDPSFSGWGDVYYFCGTHFQYCTCDLGWNLNGYFKAVVLWNFTLSAAVGLQKLIIQTGLGGLLPGEEIVTKEAFVSIVWRLIPYWLNNWEQQWGAECLSMLFELPHYALELLVVLPLVQIICARLKLLAMPHGRGLVAQMDLPEEDEDDLDALAPDILAGTWHADPAQLHFLPRLRANVWVLAFVVAMTGLAAFNALVLPLALERTVLHHKRTPPSLQATCAAAWTQHSPWTLHSQYRGASYLGARLTDHKGGLHSGAASHVAAFSQAFRLHSPAAKAAFEERGCTATDLFSRNLDKHVRELAKVCSPGRSEAIILVEAALAVMRLSCEKLFVLAAVFVAYLLFRDDVPVYARVLIRINHRISTLFQRVILYSFPAVCWLYGAGFLFSLFASFVFWASPIQRLIETTRRRATIVRPVGLKDATEEQVERMNGNCAVCWGEMAAPLPRAAMRLLGAGPPGPPAAVDALAPGKALPCGHAFHTACIRRWLIQCHAQGRKATCPMAAEARLHPAASHPEAERLTGSQSRRASAPINIQRHAPLQPYAMGSPSSVNAQASGADLGGSSEGSIAYTSPES
ncbi:hypothetical protein WJX73_002224 [Symbiochloris irregularis]|uniref:RING-type domain-containing protein n=1 Tax=Symbiochloris irregularis TaxID=706552 RepID=A0AAW1PEG5_9CHLO